MNFREAEEQDLDCIYMMGYDVWGDGLSELEYLQACRSSIKYSKGKWYVLEDNNKILLSSLLLHDLNQLHCNTSLQIKGIGSIATPIHLRRKGYASNIIKNMISYKNKFMPIDIWFLYSDIGANFYNKLGFKSLPSNFQKYTSSLLMCYCSDKIWNMNTNTPQIEIPNYF